jgi:hypothetical protein
VHAVCCSPHALTAIDDVKATITARKEKCIIVRGDKSARIILNEDSEGCGKDCLLYILSVAMESSGVRKNGYRC